MHDWDEIIRRHGPGVWKVAWRILAHDSDVADCFQETFLAAVRIAAREPVDNWGGLLRRVATLQAVKILQRRLRRSAHSLSDEPLRHASFANAPDQNAQNTELANLLREALAALPTEVAEVIALRYELQLSYAEISQALGISVNHVGVLLHRGKQQLHARLGDILTE